MRRRVLIGAGIALTLIVPGLASGHAERETLSPARPGAVPDQDRVHTVVLDVCKTGECEYEHIQAAVDTIPLGNTTPTLIRIWPGLYREEPSRAAETRPPDDGGVYSLQHHIDFPNSQNLIAVVRKKNVTLRGMGATPRDVVIDVEFKKHVGIRGDQADGLIIENLSMYHAFDHGIYILDQAGYLIDRVVSGYSRDYAFLMFATDHGVLKNCEAFGAGDAGIYPGGGANTPGRHSNEIANCKSYHNVIGYSGTQGNYIWVHDNEFYDNATGLTSDSETDHPNYPQEHLTLERNEFYDNNFNVYAADSDVFSVFGDGLYIPVGTGVLLASGNWNLVQNNQIWGHDRYGVWLGTGQALVVGPTSDPPALPYLSSNNTFIANRMYPSDGVEGEQNAVDFAWDGGGINNCWEGNTRSPDGEPANSDALFMPPCRIPGTENPMPITVGVPHPQNSLAQAGLLFLNGEPVACVIDVGGCVWGPGPAPENARNTPEGYQPPPPPPTTCGPSTCPTASSASRVQGFKATFSADASTLPATGVGIPLAASVALILGSFFLFRAIRRRA